MTEKDDPSGVAFGGTGNGGREPPQQRKTGNGANGNGIAAGMGIPFLEKPTTPDRAQLGWQILDHLDRGVIALDITGTIIDANIDARQLLDAAESLRIHNGRLEFANACLDKQLNQLLATVSLAANATHGFVARLQRGNGHRPLRVLVTPISNGASAPHVAVLVFIFDIHPERVISHDVLRDLYGLTAAQAAVTAYLFEGQSVEQTAQLLGLSVNTVRSHLKHIFTKCDVHSQTDLLHLLDLGPHSV